MDANFLRFSGDVAGITVQQKYPGIIAGIDVVKSIQEAHPVQFHNNAARKILSADVSIGGTPFRGEGQVVAVADYGFDKGDINDIPTPCAGRVAHLYVLGRPATATLGSADDPKWSRNACLWLSPRRREFSENGRPGRSASIEGYTSGAVAA
jgi:hypothetical protein